MESDVDLEQMDMQEENQHGRNSIKFSKYIFLAWVDAVILHLCSVQSKSKSERTLFIVCCMEQRPEKCQAFLRHPLLYS